MSQPLSNLSEFDPLLLDVARALSPGVKPEELLSDTDSFLNLVMAKATLKQTIIAQHHFTKVRFQHAFENASVNLYISPSWEHWCMKLYGASWYKPPPPGYPESPITPPHQYPSELISAAHIVNWYTEPMELLANTDLFLNEIMARGDTLSIQAALNHYTLDQFRSAYEFAPPGLYGPISWSTWGLKLFGDSKHKENPLATPGSKPWHWRSN